MARRPKINRNVGMPGEGEIVRLDIYRTDDNGTRFKTSISLDRELFRLATVLHGGLAAANQWFKRTAETLWEEDRQCRQAASATGTPRRNDVSISRHVQRRLIETAISRIREKAAGSGTGKTETT